MAQKLARDEAGNIWDISGGQPKFVRSGQATPNVVVPAAPPEPKFVPDHPNLIMTNGPGGPQVAPVPGVPAPAPPAPNFVPGKPGFVVTGPPNAPQAVPIKGLPAGGDDDAIKKANAIEATRNLVQSLAKARGLVDNWSTGVGGAILGHLPATEASQLDAIINQEIRGNIFKNWVDTLKAQTDQGTTGIGRIMQSEIPLVTGSLGALDPVKMGKQGTLDSLDQIQARVLRSAAMLNGENPDDPKVIEKYRQQFAPAAPKGELTPEQKAKFFDILQHQGADAADEYLKPFGIQMKDKSAADRPYSKELAPVGSYANSYAGQGLSGANEGLASVLGAPADLARAAIDLVPQGINALANTNIPNLPEPIGGGEWWKRRLTDLGSIQPNSSDSDKQFVRRVGQSVGAAAVPALGAGGSLAKVGAGLLSGLGGGIGAATAQRIAPGSTLAELAGEVAGGGATGLGLAKLGQRAAQRAIEAKVPTIADLKQEASGLYRQAETNGITATPKQTRQLASDMRKTLQSEGQLGPNGSISNADTNTSKAFNLVNQYAGKQMKPSEMNTVRKVLADSRQSSDPADRRLGGMLLDQFDNWASPLAPEFDQARSVASRYLQAQDLEKARELAGARASQFTGSGFENALRTEYRGLDRGNIKGNNFFGPDVTDAIKTVARGTPASNALRGLGKLAPTGVVSSMGSVLPALTVGASANPTLGGLVGGSLAGAGILGRIGATRMGIRAADQAELIARNGGALQQAPLLPQSLADFAAYLAASQLPKYGNSKKHQGK